MKIGNGSLALIGSLAAHALIFGILWFYLVHKPAPDTIVELDLSSVELSLAEKEDATAALAQLPMSAAPKVRPAEPEKPRPPDVKPLDKTLPPDPAALKLPEPQETKPQVISPPVPALPVAAPRQAKVDAPPRPKRTIKPEYPDGSRRRGEQGDVTVELVISAAGEVVSAAVKNSSGFSELDAAALKTVRAARFTPAKSNGRSVSASARLTLKFQLK